MRQLAVASIFSLGVLTAPLVHAQVYPQGPAAQSIEEANPYPPYPPDQVYGPLNEEGVPIDGNADYDPNAQSPEVDVTADNGAAQRYDDGYDPQAYGQFETALAAYGSWVDDSTYGRVWVPADSAVGGDFAPYATGGHWTLTEYGWTWASDWEWGWAPFHFGRWAVVAGFGWGWVPGTLWGPGWVSWRVGGGYAGWAALPPRGTVIGRPVGPRSPWRFTPTATLGTSRAQYLPAASVPGVFSRMTVVANDRRLPSAHGGVVVNAGPSHAGGVAPARLATVAPGALPRYAIQARVGTPVAVRPWVQPNVNVRRQTPQYRAPTGAAVAQPYRVPPSFVARPVERQMERPGQVGRGRR
jgi:hypothetical protein